jgi:Zn-dependent peptidase ImmA (M78 family)
MEWGFKAYANRLALEVRAELGLDVLEPLDPWQLADHLSIPVRGLSSFRTEAPLSRIFAGREQRTFSGVTVHDGPRRLVVLNDSHAATRQRNSLAHELSHGLLLHEPAPLFDPSGLLRIHVSEIEEEASYLAGVLLVTEAAALAAVSSGGDGAAAAKRYGVSDKLMTWRINQTGAVKRAGRRSRDGSSRSFLTR